MGPISSEQIDDSNIDVPPLVEVSNSDDESGYSSEEFDSENDDVEPEAARVSASVPCDRYTVSLTFAPARRLP